MLEIAGKSPDSDEFADALLNALGGITLPAAAAIDEIRSMLVQARPLSDLKLSALHLNAENCPARCKVSL
jgi:hypothetical protein